MNVGDASPLSRGSFLNHWPQVVTVLFQSKIILSSAEETDAFPLERELMGGHGPHK